MADRRTFARDLDLEQALRAIGTELAYPAADVAGVVRARLEAAPPPRRELAWPWTGGQGPRLRWSLVLAVAALLLVVAIVAAGVLGVPGIRLVFGPAASGAVSPSVPASTPAGPAEPGSPAGGATTGPSRPPGSNLGLGREVALADVPAEAGFEPRLPNDPVVAGPPDAVFVVDRRASLVWAPDATLPDTIDGGVGLILMQFLGEVDDGYLEKLIDSGTRVEPITVAGSRGYWISDEPHFLFYVDDRGVNREELRRLVGDVLIWSEGPVTYRLETSLGKEAALRIAESLNEQ